VTEDSEPVSVPEYACGTTGLRLITDRLELRPLPAEAAASLPADREAACRALGARLAEEWPASDLAGVLRRQVDLAVGMACFGVWVMIERCSGTVVGDVGFHRPPDEAGMIEVGYAVIPSRRRRGYASEAARALIGWARSQPSVGVIVAGCETNNLASIRTLERVGFRRTGVVSGEIRWRYEGERDI
jgi:RimJ/RimL family protein N-acetyltransferase